jgi:core-2/I-Branching enzyme
MTSLAVAVLAHADPAQLGRLVNALPDTPIVVHCDARTPASTFSAMRESTRAANVRFCNRQATTLSSWSLVLAELQAVRDALAWTNARHIAVLSGACFPLVSVEELHTELDRWAGRTWMWNVPVPYQDWNTPRQKDGGLWRFRFRYLTRKNQSLYVRGFPLRLPWPRSVPAELTLRASSQWKIYSREHATGLLELVDQRPDLIKFWSTTLVPDESFAASMLASRSLFGESALELNASGAWYLDWPRAQSYHPRWLTEDDFDRLEVARWAPSQHPDTKVTEQAGHRKLFARKFRSSDGAAVVDRIAAELLPG